METSNHLEIILSKLLRNLRNIFGECMHEAFLFGSYAREDYEEGSDIDVLILVNLSREEIKKHTWSIGEIASNLLIEHGIMVSPIVENRDYFLRHTDILPLYRNIKAEGVKIGA